ncbi:MAG: 50S ribosomal protein L11 methyltransferase [Anaerolineae bacterium]
MRIGVDWLEISVTTDTEAAEAIVELFNRYGQGQAVVETPVDCFEYELTTAPQPSTIIVKTYLPGDGSACDAQRRLEEGLWHLGRIYPIPDPEIRTLVEKDWAEAWKQQYHLQRIGQRTVIVPAWEDYALEPGEIAIRLEPGMAFGTGLHPTTRLCLRALEDYVVAGSDVLDVGTGSGVLSIAAAKLGAHRVLALDADGSAVTAARENVAMNGVEEQVVVRHGTLPGGSPVPHHFVADGTLELLESGHFDLILINILAPVILSLAPSLAERLAPTGRVVLAGLIESQEVEVREALRNQGLEIVERTQEKDWVALVAGWR